MRNVGTVNFEKSNICFSAAVPDQKATTIAKEIGIPRTTNLGRYLEVPSLHGRINKVLYQDLIDRIQLKFEGGKGNT